MSPGRLAVVAVADRRARELVRTVDRITGQSAPPLAIVIAATEATPPAILSSLQQRLGVSIVREAGTASAVGAAAASCSCESLLLVPAGYRLETRALEFCANALGEDDSIGVLAPGVRIQSPDGTRFRVRTFTDFGAVSLFADATSVPPILCVRQSAWHAAGGLRESFGVLALCELLLRLSTRGRLVGIDMVLGSADVGESRTWQEIWSPAGDYPEALRAVLDTHKAALDSVMEEVLIRREIGFGTLRDIHRELVRRRDADLEQLDGLRARVAHARAYLEHHGRHGFDWGDLRRPDPVSRDWGYDRGQPVDRHYIDEFLASHSSDVHGAVLEVQENDFTLKFGGPRVASSAVLDLDESNPRATHVGDLRCLPDLPPESFDCIILTQTLHVIDDAGAVLRECRRLLKRSGVLLATLPCASRVCLEYGERGDLWRVTPAGTRTLFEDAFGPGAVESRAFGNVLTNVAFLEGLAASELTAQELAADDPYFPALVGVRARKDTAACRNSGRIVLLYHRVDADADAYGLAVDPDRFEQQVAFLSRECRVVSLEELLGTPAGELPPRAVALTFDDGYVDNLERAAPILERAALPATFFLTTRWLETPGEYWWDTLERVILRSASLPLSLDVPAGGDVLSLPLTTAEERRAAHARLHDLMVHAPLALREQLSSALLRIGGAAGSRRPMVADEVRRLSRIPGASIGAHSVNHLALADQAPSVVDEEITGSRTALERVTGSSIDLFAYPYGALTRACGDAVRTRFRWACACDQAGVAASFDAARVPRVEIRDWPVNRLSERLDQVFAASAR
jgi:peptidoglycan/xylan/chitin deacetylase (PgdA/CDA1 family)